MSKFEVAQIDMTMIALLKEHSYQERTSIVAVRARRQRQAPGCIRPVAFACLLYPARWDGR